MPEAGFEPTAFPLGEGRSILLSYSGRSREYPRIRSLPYLLRIMRPPQVTAELLLDFLSLACNNMEL